MKLNFSLIGKKITTKEWVVYSTVTAALASLLSYCGTQALQSPHGNFLKDAVCVVAMRLPDGAWSRVFHAMCEVSKDGRITEEEARRILDRTSQATGRFTEYFNRDPDNLNRRATSEVSYAIDHWKALNPSPQISQEVKRQFPHLTFSQQCVLSQAEKYEGPGGIIGIRYVGMGVCEDE
jgi:hypothetical protein